MRKNVMIVDDSSTLRRMIERSLAESGFEVTSCASGKEAIELARKSPPQVVVTDLNMPECDGLALTRQLRAERQTARCPILILTTDNTPERKQEARQAGASGWVLKPFQPETLVRAIHSVCQRAEALS
jgi:two-component system, chemotaxis family, chemotaxis protein CheY